MTNYLKPLIAIVAFGALSSVSAQITILSPEGGSSFVIGEELSIQWEEQQAGTTDVITISISRDNGVTYTVIDEGVFSDYEGSYLWPNVLPPLTTEAIVKVENGTTGAVGMSDAFTVIASEITGSVTDVSECGGTDGVIFIDNLVFNVAYDVYYTLAGIEESRFGIIAGNERFISISDLGPGEYTNMYVVYEGVASNSLSFTVSGGSPQIDQEQLVVINPSDVVESEGSIDASSAVSGGVTPYAYQWYEGSDTSVPLANETASSLSGRSSGSYSLSVLDAGGCASDLVTVVLLGPEPSEFTAEIDEVFNVNLSWTDNSSDETGFEIQYSIDGGVNWESDLSINPIETDQTNVVLSELTPETEYLLRIVAINNNGSTNPSASISVTIHLPPTPVEELTTTENLDGTVTLSWVDVSDEAAYIIETSEDAVSWSEVVTLDLNMVTYTSDPLSAETGLFWRVTSFNEGGTSEGVFLFAGNFSGYGNALSYDGEDDFIAVGEVYNFSEPFTIEAWVKRSGSSASDWIVSNGVTPVTANKYLHFGFGTGGNLTLDMYANGVSSNAKITDSDWHHVAVTYDPILTGSEVQMYIDGVKATLNSNTIPAFEGINDLRIGQAFDTEFFEGTMDELRIWNYALTEPDIRAVMVSRLGGNESGLEAYYRFDQSGAALVVADQSPNFHPGSWNGVGGRIVTPEWIASDLIRDTTPPEITVDELFTNVLSPGVGGTIDELTSSIQVTIGAESIEGINHEDGTWSVEAGSFSDFSEGSYDVSVQATDLAGNVGVDESTEELIIDTTPPEITVNELLTNVISPNIEGTIDELTSAIQVTIGSESIEGVDHADGTWSVESGLFSDFAEGSYDVFVTATDLAGNIGFDESVGEITIDLTAPVVTFNVFSTTDPSPALSGEVDDVTALVEVVLEEVVYEATNQGTGSWLLTTGTLPDLSEGTYDVTVSAKDLAGNSGSQEYIGGLTIEADRNAETVQDSLALLTLYNSLGGSEWARANNWKTGEPLSNWDDVNLNAEGRVEGLTLAENKLAGIFPTLTSGLELLISLNLSDNQLIRIPDFSRYENLESLNVDNNQLEFDDLEHNMDVTGFTYSNQQKVGEVRFNSIAQGSSYELVQPVGGSANTYTWTLINSKGETSEVNQGQTDAFIIEEMTYDVMGTYTLTVTNDLVPDLTISSYPQEVLATADLIFTALGDGSTPLSDGLGLAFKVGEGGVPYDTVQQISGNQSGFLFEDLILGDYLIVIEGELDSYLPTYYPGTDVWTEASIYEHRADDTRNLDMVSLPEALPILPEGGKVSGLIESDFSEPESSVGRVNRINARRKVKRAGCSMRRFVSRGRTTQEEGEYVLVAYVQSDDEGRFSFTDLEEGRYSFTIDYPGIPMDESSEVIFDIGEGNSINNELSLQVTIYDDRISVEKTEVLGFTTKYFKDLTVFPVPTSDYVTIRYDKLIREGMKVRVLNLQGKVVQEQAISSGYNKEVQVDMQALPKGLYLLNFIDTQSQTRTVATYRIVVE